jgi:hypothetical protein
VVGGGPIAQLCCRLARHFGAGRVWLGEPSTERRSYAEASQVDHAFDPSVDAAELEGLKADAVIECPGSEPGMRGAQAAARPEGTIVVVGGGRAELDPLTILVKELRVRGCFTYVDEFAEVIPLLTDGGLQVADLTSEIAAIDDAPAAFERLRDASNDEDLHRTEWFLIWRSTDQPRIAPTQVAPETDHTNVCRGLLLPRTLSATGPNAKCRNVHFESALRVIADIVKWALMTQISRNGRPVGDVAAIRSAQAVASD